MKNKYTPLVLLIAVALAIFFARAWLADKFTDLHTFHVFETLTVIGAILVLLKGYRTLRRGDWITALVLGAAIGIGMSFATLFSPYPFFGIVRGSFGQAWLRGGLTLLVALGGLVIMRQGGPVTFHAASGHWREAGRGILAGLAVGLPLAVLNVFALQLTQRAPIDWQNPLASLLDALQPGVVEEAIYRFALWGMLWLLLRNALPRQSVWVAGLLATLAHSFSHLDDLFLQSPLAALGMGAVLTVFWGLPPLILARRRGLESAIAFHWIQDVARFLTGF